MQREEGGDVVAGVGGGASVANIQDIAAADCVLQFIHSAKFRKKRTSSFLYLGINLSHSRSDDPLSDLVVSDLNYIIMLCAKHWEEEERPPNNRELFVNEILLLQHPPPASCLWLSCVSFTV